MSDEEIIQKRLINDGEGKSDEKRLDSLLKNFIRWTSGQPKAPEVDQVCVNQLTAQINACQLAVRKDELTLAMMKEESENYVKQSKEVGAKIADAKKELAYLKPELKKAKEKRAIDIKVKMLIGSIEKLPTVEVRMREIICLKKELSQLQQDNAKLDEVIEKARENFKTLMQGALQLENPWADGEVDRDSDDNTDTAINSQSANLFEATCLRFKQKFKKSSRKSRNNERFL